MADETKQAPVPPGWVRLTDGGDVQLVRAESITSVGSYITSSYSGSWYLCVGDNDNRYANESPAEVAALIAEAERAKRRADALPVMAATLWASDRVYEARGDAVSDASVIFRLIAIQEAGNG